MRGRHRMSAYGDETRPEARQLRRASIAVKQRGRQTILGSSGFRRAVIPRIAIRIAREAINAASDGEITARWTKPLFWISRFNRLHGNPMRRGRPHHPASRVSDARHS